MINENDDIFAKWISITEKKLIDEGRIQKFELNISEKERKVLEMAAMNDLSIVFKNEPHILNYFRQIIN